MAVSFLLNGKPVRVGQVDHHTTLLQWLRGAGFTGTKEGCSEGECGACAVALVRRDARGRTRFEPVNSCLVPLPAMHGQSVWTVEGVADPSGELHPVQAAMVERGGSQCGYCTPGFVVSLFCEYYRPGRDAYDPEAIGGNLCRCTGYRPIVDVARSMRKPEASDPRLRLLQGEAPDVTPLEHVGDGVRFVRPGDLLGLFACLSEWPDATVVAGGTDLMVQANQRYDRFSTLLSLDGIAELQRFDVGPDEIVLGAGLPLSTLEERLRDEHPGEVPLLEQLLPLFSSRLIRNRATLGGNLATASPIGDAAPALLALDAEVTLAGATGQRRLFLRDFFVGYRKTALAHGEIVLSVHIRRPLPRVERFYKVSKRVLDDISTVAAAFALDLTPDGRVERLGIAYGGVASTPLRAVAVERLAKGRPWDEETLAALVAELGAFATPQGDHRGSASYRRAMIGNLLTKFFYEASS
jgi:xanthine dehydrogenase small subunit